MEGPLEVTVCVVLRDNTDYALGSPAVGDVPHRVTRPERPLWSGQEPAA
jgi:hypothetical protein